MLKRKNTTIPLYMDPWFWVKLMVFIIFALFLVWPFSSIIINAFKSSKVDGFTMANFQKFFQKKYYYGALKNSVMISVVPSIFAVLLGVPMAYLMTRYNVWGKKVWHVLAILSLMSPPFLGAYAWIMMFGRAGSVTVFLKNFGISIPTNVMAKAEIIKPAMSETLRVSHIYRNRSFKVICFKGRGR